MPFVELAVIWRPSLSTPKVPQRLSMSSPRPQFFPTPCLTIGDWLNCRNWRRLGVSRDNSSSEWLSIGWAITSRHWIAGERRQVVSPASDYLCFLAMCHHQLGHAEEARRYLDKANQWIEQAKRLGWNDSISIDNQVVWRGWTDPIETEYPRREAEALLNGPQPGPVGRLDDQFSTLSAPRYGAATVTLPDTDCGVQNRL